MTRRLRVWLVTAALFICVNVAGMWYAVVHGEVLHAGIHATLVLLAALLVWRLVQRRAARY